MQRHPIHLKPLRRFREAIDAILAIGVQVLPVFASHVVFAASLNQQLGQLSTDALVVAMTRENGWSQLANHDTDFDGAPGIVRFGPA